MNTKEILQGTYDLLSDKSKWTQHTLARNSLGGSVLPCDPSAVCFCVNGAIDKVVGRRDDRRGKYYAVFEAQDALKLVGFVLYGAYPSRVNDEKGYEAVMEMLAEAIKQEDRKAIYDTPPSGDLPECPP